MNYDEFKERLKLEIQENLSRQITFVEGVVNKANELLESLTIRFENQSVAPTIYPQKIYEDYKNGIPFFKIVDGISASLLMDTPQIPETAQTIITGIDQKLDAIRQSKQMTMDASISKDMDAHIKKEPIHNRTIKH